MSGPFVWVVAFAIAAILTGTLFWYARAIARWLIELGERPIHEWEPGTMAYQMEELQQAVWEFQRAVSAEVVPILERIVRRLSGGRR